MCNVFSGSFGGPDPFRAEKRLEHRHTGVASAVPGRPDLGRAPRAALHRACRRGARETCRAGCPRAPSRRAAPGTSRARSSLGRWRGAAPGTSRARSSLGRWRGAAPGTYPAGCPRARWRGAAPGTYPAGCSQARRCAAPGTYRAGSPQGRGSRSSGGRRYLCRRPQFRRAGTGLDGVPGRGHFGSMKPSSQRLPQRALLTGLLLRLYGCGVGPRKRPDGTTGSGVVAAASTG